MTNRSNLFLASLAYFIAVSFAYSFAVSPTFSTHAYFPLPVNFSPSRAIFLALATSIFVALLNLRKRLLADLFSLIALVFFVVPTAVLAAMDVERSLLWVLFCIVAFLPVHFIPRMIFVKRISTPSFRGNAVRRLMVLTLTGITLIFVFHTINSGALGRINFNIDEIYMHREQQVSALSGGVFAYLSIWVPRIIVPYLLIMAFFKKSALGIFLLSFLTLYFFGIMNDRQIVFIPALATLFYLFLKSKLEIYSFLLGSSVVIMVISLLAYSEVVPEQVAAIGLRRTFFVPAAASFLWYEYFSVNEFVLWSDRFSPFVGVTQYSGQSLPRIMGFAIRDDREWNANAGFVATGYANLGFAGIIVYSVLLGIVLKVYVFFGRQGVPYWLVGGLVANPLRTAWSDTDILTALTSHGLLLICLIFLFSGETRRGASR